MDWRAGPSTAEGGTRSRLFRGKVDCSKSPSAGLSSCCTNAASRQESGVFPTPQRRSSKFSERQHDHGRPVPAKNRVSRRGIDLVSHQKNLTQQCA
jgi:hypothetical protein